VDLSNLPRLVGNTETGLKNKDLIGIPWMLAFALRADGWYLRQDIIWAKRNSMPESVKDRCTKSHEYIFLMSKKPHYYFNYEAIQEEATGYDGRKDTLLKGSQKYADESYMPNQSGQTMAARGHERWHFKNLQDKGQPTHTMHERRANGEEDILYPVRNKRDVWFVSTKPVKDAHYATFPEDLIKPCILAGSREEGVVLDPFFGSGTTGRVALRYNRKYLGIELNQKYIDEIAKNRLNGIPLEMFDI
jgi:DNA modification methylase